MKSDWEQREREPAQRDAATDAGALLPCGICREGHEPGRCEVGDDTSEPLGARRPDAAQHHHTPHHTTTRS